MATVTKIPATVSRYTATPIQTRVRRKVAAYARVSTDHEDQLNSYEAQCDYYTTYIQANDEWEFAGVYSDEGISGTSTRRRDGFNRMVEDALAGRIGLILTKSVSRFARNTVDSLTTIRKLKEHGTEVYFEKENIWTFDSKGELLLTIMSSLAQEESRSISLNVTWGQRKRFADGKATAPFSVFLGYDRGENGEFVINPEQAEIVKIIYGEFLKGFSFKAIARKLTEMGIKSPKGKDVWNESTVKSILTNEKYKGCALLQKHCPPDLKEVLILRQQLAKSSVKKYIAMRNAACADGRVRGAFQFYGANRSGRWAGRNVQLQNLPQNHMEELAEARERVRYGDYDTIQRRYDSVPDVLSELIRTAFVPSAGKKLIVSDFSAVEARVIAWLAGEQWRMEVFAHGGDIYCASASQMFGVPVEKHGVNGHLRQKGKIAELALGYGGSVGALKAMGALEMGLTEEELPTLVRQWRSANPHITRLWWDVDEAVMTAVRDKTSTYAHGIRFHVQSGMLFIHLPSGRDLCYAKPRIGENQFGSPAVTYMGVGATKKWERIESYGPKFVENIVQGISRDLLCYAMRTLRCCDIVAHVHDEIILEADPRVSLDAVCEQMGRTPPWAKGLVLRADGYECAFYKKD